MFPNLDAELARMKMTRKELAAEIGVTATTLSLKLNGKTDISLSECLHIKEAIKSDKSVDYLFATDPEEARPEPADRGA